MNFKTIQKTITLVFLALGVSFAAFAQDGGSNASQNDGKDRESHFRTCSKYGPDSLATLDAASIFYYDFAAQGDPATMAKGRKSYNYVLYNAPGYQRQFIASGLKIYRNLADNTTNEELKSGYIDTLYTVYNKLIDCYDKDWYYMGRWGYDMMKYTPKAYDTIRETFGKAVDLGGLKTEYFVLYPYMRLIGQQYKDEKITRDEVFKIYEGVVNIVEHNVNKDYMAQRYEQALESVQSELKNLGVLDCESLKPYFAEKLKASPNDTALIEKAYNSLGSCETCDTTFLRYWRKLLVAKPNIKLARELAQCEMDIGTEARALKYFDKAIELEEDSVDKADLAYKAALLLYKNDDFPKSREYAYKALKYRPNWGDPYILIGRLYAASGPLCGSGTGFKSQAVVWPAIDKWQKAKQVDPTVADEANEWIGKFTEYMPTMEAIFNRDIKENEPIKIDWCWINETTIVRPKPQ